MSTWVNFNELRERLQADDVLHYYKIETHRKPNSDQAIGQCPLPDHGDNRGKGTFSVNMVKGLWQCFGCKKSGNLLDLAVLMEGKDKAIGRDVRQVALKVHQHFFGQPAPKPRKEAPQKAEPPKEASTRRTVVNPPLDFALKTLDPAHTFFAENHILPETVERFELGFCKRGALTGSIAVPLHNDEGCLVGYAGLSISQERKDRAKYQFPPSREVNGTRHVFDTDCLLYNGHRIKSGLKDLIVVKECRLVWSLWQEGFANVVALMGEECSDDQAAQIGILIGESSRVWLLADRSDSGTKFAQSVLLKVASSRFCRWMKLAESADITTEHALLASLPKP